MDSSIVERIFDKIDDTNKLIYGIKVEIASIVSNMNNHIDMKPEHHSPPCNTSRGLSKRMDDLLDDYEKAKSDVNRHLWGVAALLFIAIATAALNFWSKK